MMNKLNEIPEKNPFKVPDNYFEEVNRKIITAASGIDREVLKVSVYNRFKTSFLIAASVAGLILITYTTIKLLSPVKVNSPVSEVLHEISPDSYLNDIDLSSLEENASSLVLSEEVPDVSKKDIIDYLLNENVEINDIYAQL
jgi:hypothetical protein